MRLDFTLTEIKSKKNIIVKSKNLLKKFDEYLSIGGFSEAVLTRSEEPLKQYIFDIIQKDIVMRHSLRDAAALEKMAIKKCYAVDRGLASERSTIIKQRTILKWIFY